MAAFAIPHGPDLELSKLGQVNSNTFVFSGRRLGLDSIRNRASDRALEAIRKDDQAPMRPDFPRAIVDFQRRLPHDAACRDYLFACRWPDGFRCPACGFEHAYKVSSRFLW